MRFDEALRQLEQSGTEQNRKVYARHGVGSNTYGVSFAALRTLAKKIKQDHALAEQLWETGNHDARVLATMIADPHAATPAELDRWAGELDNYVIADAFSVFVARTPHARGKAEKWSGATGEWTGRVGWTLFARLAMDATPLEDEYFTTRLEKIESEIHSRKNRVRDAMNNALIAIGCRNPVLTRRALAAAKRIGQVEVDHGETGCKTPDAADYIQRTLARKKPGTPAGSKRASR